MTAANIFKMLLKKKYESKGDIRIAWSYLLKQMEKEGIESHSFTLNFYEDKVEGFTFVWDEMLNTDTGEIVSKKAVDALKESFDTDSFQEFYSYGQYDSEVKRIKKIAQYFESEGFKVSVGYNKEYRTKRSYAPYLVLSW